MVRNLNDERITPDEGSTVKIKRSRNVVQKDHSLPHPNATFEQHLRILQAYVIATNKGAKPVTYHEITGMVDFSQGYITGTNKFFEENGLLEKRHGIGMYVPSSNTVVFQNYKDWKDEENAKTTLRKIVIKTWFWNSTLAILRMNNGKVSVEEIYKKMGLDSKANPNLHNLCFRSILEYLKYTGLVTEAEEGLIALNPTYDEESEETAQDSFQEAQVPQTRPLMEGKPMSLNGNTKNLSQYVKINLPGISLLLFPTRKNIETIKKLIDALPIVEEE